MRDERLFVSAWLGMVTVAPDPARIRIGARAPAPRARQASLDDLGQPLSEVTFVVLDLETTGASANDCAITEVGAVKLRGGECLGAFETLVNPGVPIPPFITVLTGITEAMVLPAPRIDEVLPALLEFIGDAVIVGHNIRFDISFLDAALVARDRPRLANRHVDTLAIARRLVRDEVPNLRLSTLARHFRVPTEPIHRAFADAQATAEVLHALLERAASFGVLGLDDLLALPSMRAHPSAAKLGLTAGLPRSPGVYLFRDRDGRVLYVGKASNLRARVRSYFSTDDRRKVPQLLRETMSIDHLVCRGPLEAAVREIRLIQAFQPRFNRQAKVWRKYAYLKLTNERFPRLTVTRVARADGATYLGSAAVHRSGAPRARSHRVGLAVAAVPAEVAEAFRSRTRRAPAFRPSSAWPRARAAARSATTAYAEIAQQVRAGLDSDPAILLEPLEARMANLARAERFEEAAATRDRLAALSRAISRQRAVDQLRATRALVVEGAEGRLELRHGRLVLSDGPGSDRASQRCARPHGPARARSHRRIARDRSPSGQDRGHVASRARRGHVRVGVAGGTDLRDDALARTGAVGGAVTVTVGRHRPPRSRCPAGRTAATTRSVAQVAGPQPFEPEHAELHDERRRERAERKQARDRHEPAPAREQERVLELRLRQHAERAREAEHDDRAERQRDGPQREAQHQRRTQRLGGGPGGNVGGGSPLPGGNGGTGGRARRRRRWTTGANLGSACVRSTAGSGPDPGPGRSAGAVRNCAGTFSARPHPPQRNVATPPRLSSISWCPQSGH